MNSFIILYLQRLKLKMHLRPQYSKEMMKMQSFIVTLVLAVQVSRTKALVGALPHARKSLPQKFTVTRSQTILLCSIARTLQVVYHCNKIKML
jgi:hypothetical protein